MKAFYENLQHGQDVATAVQSAMLQLSNPLSNDPDSESANSIFEWGSFLVWGLPTVQLPKEPLTENARKALPAKQRAELLRCDVNSARVETEHAKVNALKTLNIEATYDASVLEDDAFADAAIAILELLTSSRGSHLYEESIQLAEVISKLLPFELLEKIELELENRPTCDCKVQDFSVSTNHWLRINCL